MVRLRRAVLPVLLLASLLGAVDAGSAAGAPSLYVANHDAATIFQYDVGASGLLTSKAPAAVLAGTEPVGVAISLDGRSAYVTNRSTSNVSQYDIGPTGHLSPKTPRTRSPPGRGRAASRSALTVVVRTSPTRPPATSPSTTSGPAGV